jgi:antitoxin MazE
MIVGVKKIGNSKGIILPKQLMAMCEITEKVSVVCKDNQIIITAADSPRAGWNEQFKVAIAADETEDNDVFEGLENEFDKTEWEWA